MMDRMDIECSTTHPCCTKKIYWSPIMVGVFVAIGLAIIFNVLTLGIGLSTATRNEAGMISLVIGSFIWLLVGTYIILFVSGWITGLLARGYTLNPCHGALYGFLMWTVAFLICMVLGSSAAGSVLFTISKTIAFLSVQSDVPTVQSAHKIGAATLSAFFLILAGALGGACGGYFAMQYCKKPEQQPPYLQR